MPEGPEVRREADRIAKVLEGRQIADAYFGLKRLAPVAERLRGATVTGVTTRGKALLTQFDNGHCLFSHNQLYGRWYVCKRGTLPKTQRSLRVALHTDEHSALLYSASTIEFVKTAELPEHPFIARLGPDVLDNTLRWQDIAARLLEPAFRGRALAALYLDQHCLAGIGNYLRSEILFDARLRPQQKPRDLSRGERGRLARSTIAISRRSYETGGITNKPRNVAEAQRAGATRGRYRFAVFARDGEPCYACDTLIVKSTAGSRRIYFCPECQAPPSQAAS